jgi:poly(A) polymerase
VPSDGVTTQMEITMPADARVYLTSIARYFDRHGIQGYLVGGSVRDAIMDRPSADLDLAVRGEVGPVARGLGQDLRASVVVLDADRQIYRLALPGKQRFIDMTPIEGDLADHARSRDFTIDSLLVAFDSWPADDAPVQVIDFTDGLGDLRRGVVRVTSDGAFIEDGARLLRAVRIAAELGFTIEPGTAALMRRDASFLDPVARERVRDELCRILMAPAPADSLRLLDDAGLLTAIVPELGAARGVEQPKEHYWDVLQHSIETVAAVERVLRRIPGPDPVTDSLPWDEATVAYFDEEVAGGHTRTLTLKLAALLHDVAKPQTKTIEPDGRMRFIGHPTQGADVTETIMEQLRFSNRETRMVVSMVKEHLRPGLITRDDGPTRRALYRYFKDAGEVAIDTIFLSFADYLAARGPLLETVDWKRYSSGIHDMLTRWRERPSEVLPPKLIDGNDLMRELGLEPGPVLRILLDAVKEAHAAGEIATPEEAFVLARQVWEDTPTNKGR